MKIVSRYGWSADPQTDIELYEKYGPSIHERKAVSKQTFELDEEMSLMLVLCDSMKVIYKIEILRDHDTRPISKLLYVSVPERDPSWVCASDIETLVKIVGQMKVARF